MQGFIDNLIRGWGYDPASWPWTQFVYVAFMGLFSFIVINFAAISGGIFSWAERRIAARMQSRVGPNRVGPAGFLQWIPDTVKLLFKEDLIPAEADRRLLHLLHQRPRRGQPHALRSPRGGVGAGLRLQHRVLGDALLLLLPRGVGKPLGDVGAGGHHVHGRLAGAVPSRGAARRAHRLGGVLRRGGLGHDLRAEDAVLRLRGDVAALDV